MKARVPNVDTNEGAQPHIVQKDPNAVHEMFPCGQPTNSRADMQ